MLMAVLSLSHLSSSAPLYPRGGRGLWQSCRLGGSWRWHLQGWHPNNSESWLSCLALLPHSRFPLITCTPPSQATIGGIESSICQAEQQRGGQWSQCILKREPSVILCGVHLSAPNVCMDIKLQQCVLSTGPVTCVLPAHRCTPDSICTGCCPVCPSSRDEIGCDQVQDFGF